MTPLVSIITRTKNRPRLLARTLDSVLAQTCADWQWVVVDVGDAGATQRVIEARSSELGGRVLSLAIPDSAPISVLSNAGIRASQSRFIVILDDDDTWTPDFLEKMVGFMARKPHHLTAGVACATTCVDEEIEPDGSIRMLREYPQAEGMRNVSLGLMATQNQFCVHAFLYERTALEKVGLYNEELPVLDDWEFNLRFLLAYDIGFLPAALARYHLRPCLASGEEANSQYGWGDLHKHFEAHIINQALRTDLAGHGSGLGFLLAQSASRRRADGWLLASLRRIEAVGAKVGRVDSRTKWLRDEAVRQQKRKR